jgi:hypothetical protein
VVAAEAAHVSWRTLVVLVLAVAGLLYFAMRTADIEENALADLDVAAFSGLDANLVDAVRIENVPRDLNMHFARESSGKWMLTDPLAARAQSAPLDLLVQGAARMRGPVVPPEEARDPARLGLEPPRFVLTIEEGTGADARRRRAEFGANELDGSRFFVRVDGRILLVSREIEPFLDMQLHEFLSRTVSDADARLVIEFERVGNGPGDAPGSAVDVSFEGLQEGGFWRATDPVVGQLDPVVMGLYLRSTLNYSYKQPIDEGSRTLSSLGLDPPELTLRFSLVDTEVVELVLGRSGMQRQGGWVATRTGSSIVFGITDEDMKFVAIPLEDLLDHQLIRARRGGIQRLDISSPRGEVRLVRGARGWSCAIARAGSRVFGPEEPAESRVIEDVLGELDRYELTGFLRGAAFEHGPAPVHWRIVAEDGEYDGTFGAPYTDAAGATDVLFQRDGDTAVAHGDPKIVAGLTREPEQFLSLRLLEVTEADLSGIRLRGAAGERYYARNAKGIWTRPGGEVEARELHGVLDGLLFLRASERIPEALRAPLEEKIGVDLEVQSAVRTHFDVGLATHDGARRVEAEVDGRRAVLADTSLHAKLATLIADTAPR